MNYPVLPQVFSLLLSNNTYQLELLAPLLFIALDIITGIMSACRQGTFEAKKLKDSLGSNFLHYIVVEALILSAWATRGSSVAIELATTLGSGLMVISLVHSIWQNLHEVFSPKDLADLQQLGDLVGISDPLAGQTPAAPTTVSVQPQAQAPAVSTYQPPFQSSVPTPSWSVQVQQPQEFTGR